MASTVPGIDRESIAAKLGIGVQTPDLSTLAAPTISLDTVAPGFKLGQLRWLSAGKADRTRDASPSNGDRFAATLAKAIAARKAANENASRTSAARQPRVEARAEREHAVRDVAHQLKQLVDAAREAKSGSSVSSPKQAGRAIAQRDSEIDAAALQRVFERLSGTEAERVTGEDPSLTPDAEVQALLQTVADTIAQAMSPNGEIDEAALAAALIADPLVQAAVESLIAALQAQLVTAVPVALPASQAEGESVAGGEVAGGTSRPIATAATADVTDAPASVEASTTPVASLSSPALAADIVALDASPVDAASVRATAASTSIGLEQASVVSEVVASAAAPSEAIVATGETSASAPTTTAPASSSAAPAISVATLTPEAGVDTAANATVQTAVAPVDSSASPEAPSLTSVAVEASVPVAIAGGEEAVVSGPLSGTDSATVLTQATSGRAGTQAGTDGQPSEGDGGDAPSAGNTAVQAARVNASATNATQSSSESATAADADGVAVGQAAQNGSAAQNTTSTTPSTTAGVAAPAQRAEAAAQTQGAQDLTPDVELHEQVSPVIVRQARLINSNGGHELTVRLNPDHLGPLHVRISLLEGVLSVGLTTANPEAQRALENAMPQLRGALVESGLRVDRLDVSQRDAGSGGSGSGNGQSGSQRGSANAGRGGNQPEFAGNGTEGRQANTGNSGQSFADVLLDQDGRVFGSVSRSARWMGYRAYRRG